MPDDEMKRLGNTQWSTTDDKIFFPTGRTQPTLYPGIYSVGIDATRGLFFRKENSGADDLIRFEEAEADQIMIDIDRFWESGERFKTFGLVQKRGILLYGPAGTGKTSICRMVMEDVVEERDGIVINLNIEIDFTVQALKAVREIQPDTPIVVLIEDIDEVLEDCHESSLINMLDGVDAINKVIFLASTNKPQELEARIVNRPSRFDYQIFIGALNEANRRIYIDSLFQKDGINDDVDQWVGDTKDLSIAHIKELFTSVHILRHEYPASLDRMRSMRDTIKLQETQAGFKQDG